MVPRGTRLQRLLERVLDVTTPVCKGNTQQQSHTSLPRVTTIPWKLFSRANSPLAF